MLACCNLNAVICSSGQTLCPAQSTFLGRLILLWMLLTSMPLLTELYTRPDHPRAPWLMQSCKWCKKTSPKNELLISMGKSVSDRRLPPPRGKKIRRSKVYGLLSPCAGTCKAPALGDTSTGSPQVPGQAWGWSLSDSLCRCLVKSLTQSAAVLVKCTAFCIFTALYFVFSHPSACLSVQLQAPPKRNL